SVGADDAGRYAFRKVDLGVDNAPRSFGLDVSNDGYWPTTAFVTVACGVTTRADVRLLRKRTGSVSGRVVVGLADPADPSAGRQASPTAPPRAGATVALAAAPTGADGRYSATLDLAPGNAPRGYSLTAQVAGYWPQTKAVTAEAGAAKSLDFELVRKCTA